jgi:hypothetical protein
VKDRQCLVGARRRDLTPACREGSRAKRMRSTRRKLSGRRSRVWGC